MLFLWLLRIFFCRTPLVAASEQSNYKTLSAVTIFLNHLETGLAFTIWNNSFVNSHHFIFDWYLEYFKRLYSFSNVLISFGWKFWSMLIKAFNLLNLFFQRLVSYPIDPLSYTFMSSTFCDSGASIVSSLWPSWLWRKCICPNHFTKTIFIAVN